jgi:hypothetical protein
VNSSGLPIAAHTEVFDAAGELVADMNGRDIDGRFLAPSSYGLSGDHTVRGYGDAELGELWSDIPCANGTSCDPTVGTVVEVTDDTQGITARVAFELAPGGAIRGAVSTAGSAALPDGSVQVFASATGEEAGSYLITSSDRCGAYYLGGLPSGTYYLGFHSFDDRYADAYWQGGSCDGHDCPPPSSWTPITLSAPDEVANIDLVLLPSEAFIFCDGFNGGDAGAWSNQVP